MFAAARLQVWTDHRAAAVRLGNVSLFPAAAAGSYSLFLLALFVIASGLGFLETGANPLITQLGDPGSAVRRLNFSQAFNPIGSIAGVLIGTVFIFSGVELKAPDIARLKVAGTYNAYLHHETMRVVPPYMVIGAVVLLWALLIFLTPFPAVAGAQSAQAMRRGQLPRAVRYPHFLLAVVAQFCYVGAQVGTWSYFIQYVQDYTHLPEKTAGYFLTGTLAGFGVGRFGSSHWMKLVRASTLMGIFAVANIVLVAIGIVYPGWVGVWAIFLTSFFMSLMFPTISLSAFKIWVRTQAGRLSAGDVDHRRRPHHPARWTGVTGDQEHGDGHGSAAALLSLRRVLRILGLQDSATE